MTGKALDFGKTSLLLVRVRDVDGEGGRLQVWRGKSWLILKSNNGRSVQLTTRSPANTR